MPNPALGTGDAAENETWRVSLLKEEEGWETTNTQARLRERSMLGDDVPKGAGRGAASDGCPWTSPPRKPCLS